MEYARRSGTLVHTLALAIEVCRQGAYLHLDASPPPSSLPFCVHQHLRIYYVNSSTSGDGDART